MIYILQHIECETLGTFESVLQKKNLTYRYIRPFQGEPVPNDLNDMEGLIIMGGPMGVYEEDQYPYLSDEIRLIKETLRRAKPVLGVCLGSQLLAHTLGAPVTKAKKKEIGWFSVYLTEDAKSDSLFSGVSSPLSAMHWHGDVFDLPKGAAALASSDLTKYQAFRYGKNAYGILFHLEVTKPMIEAWTLRFRAELESEHLDPAAILKAGDRHFNSLEKAGTLIFNRWADLLSR